MSLRRLLRGARRAASKIVRNPIVATAASVFFPAMIPLIALAQDRSQPPVSPVEYVPPQPEFLPPLPTSYIPPQNFFPAAAATIPTVVSGAQYLYEKYKGYGGPKDRFIPEEEAEEEEDFDDEDFDDEEDEE